MHIQGLRNIAAAGSTACTPWTRNLSTRRKPAVEAHPMHALRMYDVLQQPAVQQ